MPLKRIKSKIRVALRVQPYSVGRAIPCKFGCESCVQDSDYQTIGTYDPVDKMDVAIDTTEERQIFIIVQGTGNMNSTGYGSLGSYTVNGNLRPMGSLPVRLLALKGNSASGTHYLTGI